MYLNFSHKYSYKLKNLVFQGKYNFIISYDVERIFNLKIQYLFFTKAPARNHQV